MRIAICEDEQIYRDMLKSKVLAYFNKVDADTYNDGIDLLKAIDSGRKYDLIFMDLQMDHSDGMETAARIRGKDRDVKIIFVTGIENRATEGYRVAAFDYIVKSELDTTLIPALDRFTRESETEKIAIETEDGETVIIPVKKILWIESEKRGTRLAVMEKRVGTPCKEYHSPLPIGKVVTMIDPSVFIEVYKSVYVQTMQIRRLGNDKVIMSDGSELPLSRRKRKAVMSEVLKNVRNRP
ncbi:MAG: LytTR family DNA-binding domain-containing protein [Lachnospiraceae bacterium]|nr:LytTR family DNA-binding domain-containing protein [Lachnospiraceae bacterium]